MFHSNADTAPFREHCYYFSRDQFTWHSGLAHCESLAGKLVSYDSVEEENFVKEFLNTELPSENWWIGLVRNANYWARNTNGGMHNKVLLCTIKLYLKKLTISFNTHYELVNS